MFRYIFSYTLGQSVDHHFLAIVPASHNLIDRHTHTQPRYLHDETLTTLTPRRRMINFIVVAVGVPLYSFVHPFKY